MAFGGQNPPRSIVPTDQMFADLVSIHLEVTYAD